MLNRIAAVCILASTVGCVHRLEIPRPVIPPGGQLPEAGESTIDLPVTVDLSSIPSRVNAVVPPGVDAMGAWTMVANDRVGIKYKADRASIGLSLKGKSLKAETTVQYEAEGCLRVKKPWPLSGYICPKVASCGQGEPKRLVQVAMGSDVAWTADWHLESKTSFSLTYPNHCTVTVLNYDVTPYLDKVLKPQLAKAATTIDAKVQEKSSIKALAQRGWDELKKPREIAPRVWLAIRPREIRAAAFNGDGLTLNTSVGITASPILVAGNAPTPREGDLPKLNLTPPANGFRLRLRGSATYEELTARLREQLKGKMLTAEGHEVTIKDIAIRGENGTAVVAIDFEFPSGFLRWTTGTAYLTGRPGYDVPSQTFAIEELDYSADTQAILIQGADWLLHDTIRGKLREKARWPMGDRLAKLKDQLAAAFPMKLADGVGLDAKLEELRPVGAETTDSEFGIYVDLSGQAHLEIAVPAS